MKIYSKTHTITALAALAIVLALDARGKPVSKTAVIDHPAGTVLDMDDADAQDLIDRGVAVEYKDEDHKDAPKGRVIVETTQMQTALPAGATQPSVVRQDETVNDGPKGAEVGAKVHFDTKDAAAIDADKAAALAAPKPVVRSPEQLAADAAAAEQAAIDAAAAEAAKRGK